MKIGGNSTAIVEIGNYYRPAVYISDNRIYLVSYNLFYCPFTQYFYYRNNKQDLI